MIADLLLRFGIPKWAAILALCAIAATSAIAYRHHLIQQGVSLEAARRDKIDADNTAKAETERGRLNALVAKAQAELDAARADVAKLEKDRDHDKTISTDLQRRLLAGTERERVLVHVIARAPDSGGQASSATAGGVDQGAPIVATLDGRVASDLEWARQTRSEAITRLGACVIRYDALKKAVDDAP